MKNFSRTLVATISLTIATSARAEEVSDLGLENGKPAIRNVLPIESHYYTHAIETKNRPTGKDDFSFNFGSTPDQVTVAITDVPARSDTLAITESEQATFPFTLAIVSTSVAAIILTGFAAAWRSPTPNNIPMNDSTNTPAPKGARSQSGKKSSRAVQNING